MLPGVLNFDICTIEKSLVYDENLLLVSGFYRLCTLNGSSLIVAAECKLSLAPARVLAIASRANAKSLHELWPIRTPTSSCANQDA